MMGEKSLLELLTNAITQGLFTEQFLSEVGSFIEKKLISI